MLSWINSSEMSEGMLLVRHPAPNLNESLFGYLLRLSEVNGYQNITPMMNLAGIKERGIRKLGMEVTAIASIAHRPVEELEAIAHYDPTKSYARIAGHRVLRAHLRRLRPAICPECVEEKGYIEAQWELLAMTGCPVHKRALLSSCNSCGEPLTWFRPGLLVCSCGGILTGQDLPSITLAEVDLLQAIRSCVLRLTIDGDGTSGMPVRELSRMDVNPLITLIRAVGRSYQGIQQTGDETSSGNRTACAAKVLSDWPNGLFNLLEMLMTADESTGFTRGNVSGLYLTLFSSKAIPDRTQVEFVKRVFVEFAAKHWGGGVAVRKLLRPYDIENPEDYITQNTLAKRLNIGAATVAAHLEDGTVAHLKIEVAGVERALIDIRKISIMPLLPGRLLRERKAAAEIGISVALLRALKDSGTYEVRSAPSFCRGFHEVDLQRFIETIRSLACVTPASGESELCMTVRRALHELRHSLEAQESLIQSILTRHTRLTGSSSTQIVDLQIPVTDFRSVYESKMPIWLRETLTSRDAGKLIGCYSTCVLALVMQGHLQEQGTPIGMRITQKSVEEFAKTFVSLAAIAVANRTRAPALTRSCQIHGIFTLLMKSKNLNTSFVRREDIELVVEHRQRDRQNKFGGVRREPERIRKSDGRKAVVKSHLDIPSLMPSCPKQDRSPTSSTLSWTSASDEIECGREGISLLIARGLLVQKRTSLGSRITKQSLARFTQKFISMSELSRTEATKPRRLQRLCEDNGIPVITVRSRMCNHSFIHREDRDGVVDALAISRTAS
jgi:hypothetical protein